MGGGCSVSDVHFLACNLRHFRQLIFEKIRVAEALMLDSPS